MKKFINYKTIFLAIGIVGLVVMIINLDPGHFPWHYLLGVNGVLFMLGLFALWAVIYCVHTAAYKIILGKSDGKLSFWALMRIVITGFALNNVTPFGLFGGEPYRIMELKKYYSTAKASSATLSFSIFYVMGHFLLWLTAVILYFIIGYPGETYLRVVMSVAAAVCTIVVILFLWSKKRGFVVPFVRFCAKIPLVKKVFIKMLETNMDQLMEVDDNIRSVRCHAGKAWSVLALQYLSRILEAAEYMFIFMYFGHPATLVDGILIMGIASLVGNVVFFIPMQVGTRESGLLIAASALGITSSVAGISGLVYRFRDIVCIFIGVVLMLIKKRKKKRIT